MSNTKSTIQRVREFHQHLSLEIDTELKHDIHDGLLSLYARQLKMMAAELQEFCEIEYDARMFRCQLLIGEVGEVVEALANVDRPNLLHELADLEFVVNGTAVQYGLPLEEAFHAVADSNMTKTRSVGIAKRWKGPEYRPADVRKILEEHDNESIRDDRRTVV